MSRADIAKEHFLKGYTCAQAVLLAFSDLTHADEETAKKNFSAFRRGNGPPAPDLRLVKRRGDGFGAVVFGYENRP